MCRFSADKNRDELKGLGVLEALVPLLSSPVDVLRNVSTCLIATLTKSYEVRRTIRQKCECCVGHTKQEWYRDSPSSITD
jgi:hypothetical protein